MENIDIGMIRPSLKDLPDVAPPEGFSIRLYRPGDGPLWVDIVRSAERFLTINDDRFDREFGHDLESLGDRMHFLSAPSGLEVGTATAWYWKDADGDGLTYGLVHWVAVRPEWQGRGLGKPLLSVVMRRLARSYDRALLNTSSGRIPALKCYLDFGFVPNMAKDRAAEAWSHVRSVLGHPTLMAMEDLAPSGGAS